MKRGDIVYFIDEGKLMKGEYYRVENGYYIIKKTNQERQI